MGLCLLPPGSPSQRVQFILRTKEDEQHVPHRLFSELDEICVKEGQDAEWKETARWLKFEEDAEDGGERWSKPYVGTLSLHSLSELRSCISNGTVLLDVCANSIEECAAERCGLCFWGNCLKIACCAQAELHFMKKIPTGAEASNVLVGELDFLHQPIMAFVRLSPAVLLSGMTEVPIPTRFLFVLLGPEGKGHQYHEIGRSMATIMTDEVFRDVAYKAKNGADLVAGVDEFLDQVTVLPPGEWDPSIRIEPPKNVPGGLTRDVKRKAPWFWSDFRDGLSLQCLASFLFLYCACMSPVITFGGLLGEATNGHISAMESLLGASMAGVVYSLFAGQPLTILGSTGPVLVFEKILYKFCKEYTLSYLSLRACIGLWTAFLCIVLVATDASCLVCYVTRFTEEAFASLICIIFIYEALEKLSHLRDTYPVHTHSGEFQGPACGRDGPYTPDVFFWCCILFFATFALSSFLKKFKTSRYFPTRVRSTVSDFAVFLTIVIMVLLDFVVGIPSPKLHVPHAFKPTRDDRGWFINPIGPNPWWTVLAALVPALLCTILIFMDQQISAVIVNRKEHKLKKGCGYHLDLFMVAVMLGVCSVMGLPWFVAATVLSITHVNSLKVESDCSAPGEQPKFLGIREQRVTGLLIFALMGCSVFFTSVLKFIPMPVLYGVFLYMGVSSLRGIQFFDRLKLFWMPAKHQPDFIYLRHVPLRKVHFFTAIQLICLVLLWTIKVSRAAIIFPLMVLALVFVRKAMDLCFSKRELSFLDDLMPERKKKLDDGRNEAGEEEEHSVQNETTVAEFILLGFCSTPALQRCLFGLFSTLCSATLMGNALVFLLICLDYCLHSPMYFFLCHLSIVDICASSNVPHMLRSLLGQGRTISFAGCGAQIHLYLIFALTECVLLAVMSSVRYVAICRPLRYALITIWRLCLTLAPVPWALAFVFGTLQASLALHLPFCGPCEVVHFSCEILAVLKLACTAARADKVLIFAVCVCFFLFPLALVLISSLDILATVLRIRSAPGWHRTFSTCGSHPTVVGVFYGNAIFMYVGPGSGNLPGREKVLSLFYSLVSPSVNPVIYSGRSKQVKEALLKLQRRKRRHDEEAVIDRGRTSNTVSIRYEKEELEGHRTLYVGAQMPLVRQSHRHHRRHGQKHRKGEPEKDSAPTEQGYHCSPSQRVQFILRTKEDEQHVPHRLFSELDEICVKEGQDAEWKETARWLKFEEDAEDGGERWSKPYVGTLSLHSLSELRSCISNGTVLLDVCANSIEEIADMILAQQEQSTEFDEHMRAQVREVLLRKHHHQNEKTANLLPVVCSFADVSKRQSDLHLLCKPAQTITPCPSPTAAEAKDGVNRASRAMDLSKAELHFMKKIPTGAEASNVLVGELDFLHQPIMAFVRLSPAVLLSGMTEVPIPTRFLFVLLGPEGKGHQYHEIGRSMATIMTDEVFRDVAYKAKNGADLVAGVDEFLDQVTVLPPGEWDPSIRIEPPKNVPSQEKRKMPGALDDSASHSTLEKHGGPELQRTGRLFGGLTRDVKRKAPWFWSDFRDGLSLQCLASFLFLYCACMSPVITFGGLLGEATNGHISAMESLLGASMAGVVYSLFAGQPLTVLGSTGPVLVFEKILYKFCKEYTLSYLSLRACIGLWTAFLCIVLVATDASCLVCYVTRFTEEAFASLICIIFIYEALEKLSHLRDTYPVHTHSKLDFLTSYYCKCEALTHPSNETLRFWESNKINVSGIAWENLTVTECRYLHGEFQGPACGRDGPYTPDVFFWCCILFFATFALSSFLKKFKTSRYFPTRVRSTVSDFAVFLTIVIMVLLDFVVGIPSPKLHVPHAFKPTRDDRGWFINPIGPNPWWTVLAALVPALLCTILIFMDQQISAVIVNRKEHKLKKGCGYHLDLFMVAVMLGVCSVMGLPWFVAATVLSITHVNSLKVESDCSAPGEQPKFLGIREQRVTGLLIFALMGCSVFFTSVLKFIPMPVLYGVFLYMGVSSLRGIQFFDRLKLFWMPAKHQPDFIYLRHVPLRKVHFFTAIQLICLVLLWTIKVSRAAIIFPLMVLALVFVRKAMDLCFSKRELSFLDDLMPERKKKLDDGRNEAGEEEESQKAMEAAAAASSVQLSVGQTRDLEIPKQSSDRTDPSEIIILDEMSQTPVWKALTLKTETL
ncbi:LOW QUALITY PROTEIN: uncharacterized protein ACIBXB_002879 [Morphnus guianensis]